MKKGTTKLKLEKLSVTDYLIQFAEKLGNLTSGLNDLRLHFDNHLSQHKLDRVLQVIIIFFQIFILIAIKVFVIK